MPYSKDISTYPAQFASLYKAASEKDITLKLPTINAAMSLMHRLHAYRRAIEDTTSIKSLRDIRISRKDNELTMSNFNKILEQALENSQIKDENISKIDAYEKELDRLMTNASNGENDNGTQ